MPYGIDTSNISLSTVPAWVWLLLVIVGILLCFFGELIWEFMVSILGAIIGSMIGFALGMTLNNYLCAFGLMIICAIIGSMLFRYIAKAAVALLCGLLAFGAAAYLTYSANPNDLSTPVIVGLIAGVIVFFIALVYVEEIVSVFLAAIGGFLIGVGVFFLVGGDTAIVVAVLAGIALFIVGAIFQVMYQRERKKGRGPPQRQEPARQPAPTSTTTGQPPVSQPPTQQPPVQGPTP